MLRVYRILTYILTPIAHVWLRLYPAHREVSKRLRPDVAISALRAPVIIHACSVGEFNTALPFYRAVVNEFPDEQILMTVSTPTAMALVKEKHSDIKICYLPIDLPGSIQKFFNKLKPKILIQVETEIWPNLFIEAQKMSIPILIVNGRLSDKHFPRYEKYKGLFAPVFQSIRFAGVQSEKYKDRFISLGMNIDNVSLTGNLKFDAVCTELDQEELNAFRGLCQIQEGAGAVLVFGSTRPGDEALAIATFEKVKKLYPELKMIIAPRHIHRKVEVIGCLGDHAYTLRSEITEQVATVENILILDTLGELLFAYACADVAVVGGSFYPGVNGHNPLEPVGLGRPTVFGYFMSNFEEAASLLLEENAALQVQDPEELADTIVEILGNPDKAEGLVKNSAKAIQAGQGAIDRNIELIRKVLR